MIDLKTVTYQWDENKNRQLVQTRNISFQDVMAAIKNNQLIAITKGISSNHKEQMSFIIKLKDYVYVVPFVADKQNQIFLKTAYPSRKYTKFYLNL